MISIFSWKSGLAIFILLGLTVACDTDEPEKPIEFSNFRFVVTDEFIAQSSRHIIILSDSDGQVLFATKLDAVGVHVIEVPDKTPGKYHVSIFDGVRSMRTFAFLPFGEFVMDWQGQNNSSAGTHTLSIKDPTMMLPFISGENLSSATMTSRGNYDLIFKNSTSDLYLLSEKDGEPIYVYFPTLNVGQSTNADLANGDRLIKQPATFLPGSDTPNITLSGSTDVDDQMEYYLSNSNATPFVLLPSKLFPRIKFFTTTYVNQEGSYSSISSQPALQQKALNALVAGVEVNFSSVKYSVDSPESVILWTGWSSTLLWQLISEPGNNVIVTLPNLSEDFMAEFGFDMDDFRFMLADVQKDTRYRTYTDYTRTLVSNNFKITTTPYEQFTQKIKLPG